VFYVLLLFCLHYLPNAFYIITFMFSLTFHSMLHLRLSNVMLTKVLTYLELILRVHATFSLKRPHFLFISPPGHHLFYTHGQALGCGLLSVYRYGNSVDVGSIHQLDGHSIAAALTPDVSAPPITTHSVTTSSSPLARHYSLSLSVTLSPVFDARLSDRAHGRKTSRHYTVA